MAFVTPLPLTSRPTLSTTPLITREQAHNPTLSPTSTPSTLTPSSTSPVCTLSSPRSRRTSKTSRPEPHPHTAGQQRPNTRPRPRPRPRPGKIIPAPVVDARVACRQEVHHWVTVRTSSRRIFERAAVAQADLVLRLEQSGRAGLSAGALHRWVLREHSTSTSTPPEYSRYLCSESYATQATAGTKRWLAAVQRVGPLLATVDTHSRSYDDVFTAKMHDVQFNPHTNAILLSTFNIERDHTAQQGHVRTVLNALSAKAERDVGTGTCLEVSVLHATPHLHSIVKTVAVFPSMDALQEYVAKQDQGAFGKFVRQHLVNDKPAQQIFTPVVFS